MLVWQRPAVKPVVGDLVVAALVAALLLIVQPECSLGSRAVAVAVVVVGVRQFLVASVECSNMMCFGLIWTCYPTADLVSLPCLTCLEYAP